MDFWIYMLFMDLIIPVSMIVFGRLFMTKPPKNINYVFGYRTTMSMKNKDTWEFAHRFCGKLWFRYGFVLLPISVLPLLFAIHEDVNTVGIIGGIICAVQLVLLAGVNIPTEIALKKTFDQNGVRR